MQADDLEPFTGTFDWSAVYDQHPELLEEALNDMLGIAFKPIPTPRRPSDTGSFSTV